MVNKMKRLLFVDDEADILRGLKRMLRPYKDEWDVVVANSGDEALQLLDEKEFDCIVSDMRMPKMNGAELLTQVYEKHPHVARFVLSGHADTKPILQAVPVTHQFLSKPCTPDQLTNVVNRALNLHNLVQAAEIKKAIGQVDSLPSRPQIFSKLTVALTNDNTSLEDIANIIEEDIGVSAKVLQVVNSAFFGLPQNMTEVKAAVSYLGVNMIKSLVLSEEMGRSFIAADSVPGFSIDTEYKKSFMCAHVAKKMIKNREDSENAFMAGVLHRIGRLVLAQHMAQKMVQIMIEHKKKERPLSDIEIELVGATSECIGAYLLGLWGLPYPVVEAVAHCQEPWVVPHKEFQILDALYLAINLVHEFENDGKPEDINMKHLQKLGVADKLDEWRAMSQELLGSENE